MRKIWTDAEKDYIRKHASTMKDKEIAVMLTKLTGREVTIQSVRKQRQVMNIKKKPGRGMCGVIEQKEAPVNSGNNDLSGVPANLAP